MATFLEAQTRLLSAINRPSSEADVLAGVKAAINDAILYIQRNQAFTLTEQIKNLTLPASTLSVDLSTIIASTVVRDIMSVQQVTAAGVYQGPPVKLMSYAQVQAMRMKYYRTHSSVEPYSAENSLNGWTIEDGYSCDKIAFITGQNFGIYPMPATITYYALNLHAWLPALSADADTNFLLTYAYDVVYAIALKKLHIFMKEDGRFSVTEQEVSDMLAGLIAWDSQLRESPNTTLA